MSFDFQPELDGIFDRYIARDNLIDLKLYRALGIEPPKVRWMPRRGLFKRIKRHVQKLV